MKFINIKYEYTNTGDNECLYINDVCVLSGTCAHLPEALEAVENTLNLLGIDFTTKSVLKKEEYE